jgi:pimeloyl-ACP methyl ester carboxylesterase
MPIWLWIVIGIAVIAVIVFFIMGYKFFKLSLDKNSNVFESSESDNSGWSQYEPQHSKETAWLKAQSFDEVDILAGDGLKLHGHYHKNPKAKRAVICAHGYHGTWSDDFASAAPWLFQDCSVLLIDQRCCGQSKGQYYTFGAMESEDVILWASWLDKMTAHHLPIYLYGISLGASTVLICSNHTLPSSVKGIIGDCGYTSMEDIFSSLAWRWFHIPGYPLVWFVAFWCRVKGHFSLYKADARKALQHSQLPVLLIHGTGDDFVLPKNSQQNYDACSSKKELVWIKDASHAAAHIKDPESYEAAAEKFFAACEGNANGSK